MPIIGFLSPKTALICLSVQVGKAEVELDVQYGPEVTVPGQREVAHGERRVSLRRDVERAGEFEERVHQHIRLEAFKLMDVLSNQTL